MDARPSLLLFVAPEVRHVGLWSKIEKQFEHAESEELGCVHEGTHMKVAEVMGTRKRVALMSWATLLNHLENADISTASNVRQLKGLARAQDDVAFSPLHARDLSTSIPRRILDYNRIVDDVVYARGVHEGWMSTKGLKAAPQSDGYLRYFRFVNEATGHETSDLAICVSYAQWAKRGTPLWLRIWGSWRTEIDALRHQLEVDFVWQPGDTMWIPLELRTGAELDDVLEVVVAQVKKVHGIVLAVAN